jgi:hypothetical protein
MRRATHSGHPLSIFLLAVSFCSATLALPPKAEAGIHLGDPNTVLLSNGLVGYWPLDGTVTDWATGITRDLSGNGNTGQLISMSTTTSPTRGKIGQAMNFRSAVASYIPTNFSQSGDGSLSVWINYSSLATAGGVIDNEVTNGLFGRNDPGGLGLYFGIHGHNTGGPPAINLNTWYHVVLTWSGSTAKYYLNSALNATTDMGANVSLGSFTMGKDDTGTCNCKIDDVRVYTGSFLPTK